MPCTHAQYPDESSYDVLKEVINPLEPCSDYGINLYNSSVQFVTSLLQSFVNVLYFQQMFLKIYNGIVVLGNLSTSECAHDSQLHVYIADFVMSMYI